MQIGMYEYVCINNNKSTESRIILAKGANIHIAQLTSAHCLNFIVHILITANQVYMHVGKEKTIKYI